MSEFLQKKYKLLLKKVEMGQNLKIKDTLKEGWKRMHFKEASFYDYIYTITLDSHSPSSLGGRSPLLPWSI